MSQADMLRKQNEEARLSSQEEEDLARALAESLQTVNQTNHLFGGESSTSATFASQAANSHQNKGDLSPLQLPIEFPPEAPTYVSASTFQPLKEDVDSKWQVGAAYNPLQEGPPSGASQSTGSPPHFPSATAASSYPTEVLPQDRLESLDNLPVYSDRLSSSLAAMESLQRTETDESRLVFDDEAYARQLLAEEEDQFQRRMEEKGRMEAERQQRPEPDRLPQYTSEGLLSPDMPPSDSGESSRRSSNANEVPQLVQSQPPRIVASSSTPSTFQSTSQIQSPFSANEQHPPLQTVNSSTSISSSTQSSQAGRPRINQHTNQARPHSSSMSSPDAGPSNVPQLTRHSSAGVVNPNHFLDRELLAGVCEYLFYRFIFC
jgi:cell division septum initiation protein DivIVA